jgi:hypothetical protein
MTDQVLERFHRALIEEVQTRHPEYLTGPFTVAEIYQDIVPYGSHRDRIGVEMNGDYEDALIRLLAGEGNFLILESEPALRDLRAELEASNPNTGLYREFAAVDVRLNPEFLDLSAVTIDMLPDLAQELEVGDSVMLAELAPSEGAAASSDMGIVPPGVDIFAVEDEPRSESRTVDESGSEPIEGRAPLDPGYVRLPSEQNESTPLLGEGTCVWCRAELPERANLNFCPFCGTDLKLVPCGTCGEEIEPSWLFCASCGTRSGD